MVNDELIAFHRNVAAGGVGMTTLAYCAVAPDGCGTPNELILTPEITPGLARLADAVHDEGAAVSAQIGHAGAVAAGTGLPGLSPSPVFSPLAMKRTKAVSVDRLRGIVDDFAAAARVVADAGFDAVEVHLGHGYLPSEFLSPRLNKRTDEWGGSLENRARFPRAIVTAVREAVGDRLAVLAKLNMADGVRGGLWLDESVEVARMLEADGALDAIELTAGSSLQNPMYLFRGEAPVAEMSRAMPKADPPGVPAVRQGVPPRVPLRRRRTCCPTPASSGPRCRCRSCCSAASTGSTRCRVRWPRASSSWRWAGHCCASPIS